MHSDELKEALGLRNDAPEEIVERRVREIVGFCKCLPPDPNPIWNEVTQRFAIPFPSEEAEFEHAVATLLSPDPVWAEFCRVAIEFMRDQGKPQPTNWDLGLG